MQESRKIYTLSDLGRSLRSVIEKNYTTGYWIKAEIAKLNYYPRSGHCYPELVDKTGSTINAQMRAILWGADYNRLNKAFIKVTSSPLEEGMQILFLATLSFHPVHGLSLQIRDIEPAFTLGEMAMEKTRVVDQLKKEGIFEKNKTLPLALLPKRIAVISVETSKGYQDFLKIFKEKAGKYAIWHYLFPSVLQGDKAAEGLISQLRIIRKITARFDMVAIIRGGGGDIGLNCYDDYGLAREIAMFPLPVITGIGHSTNETVAEMVAWNNKITPTDVAYFVIEKFEQYRQRVETAAKTLSAKGTHFLSQENQKLGYYQNTLGRELQYYLENEKSRLGRQSNSLVQSVRQQYSAEKRKLEDVVAALGAVPLKTLFKEQCLLDNHHLRLEGAVKSLHSSRYNQLEKLADKMELLDPAHVLARGYSITLLNGNSIRDASQLKDGDVIETRLQKGVVGSVVKK